MCNNKPASEEDLMVRCSGICNSMYHVSCIKIGKRGFNAITSYPKNIRWFCGNCESTLFDVDGCLVTSSISNDTKEAVLFNKILAQIQTLSAALNEVRTDISVLMIKSNSTISTFALSQQSCNEPTTPKKHILSLGNHISENKLGKLRSKSVSEGVKIQTDHLQKLTNQKTDKHEQEKWNSINVNKPKITSTNMNATTYATVVSPMMSGQSASQGQKCFSQSNIKQSTSTGTVIAVKAAPKRKAFLHIWNAAEDTSADSIVAYIKERTPETDVTCEKLAAKGKYASFKVGINQSLFETWLKPELWPNGLFVKRFFSSTPEASSNILTLKSNVNISLNTKNFNVKKPINKFYIFHLNIQSLRKKFLEFDTYLNNLTIKPDILCFSEHWLYQNEVNFYNFDNYDIGSFYSRKEIIHGGLIIFTKKYLDTKDLVWIHDFNIDSQCEFTGIEIKTKSLVILLIYRPPKGKLEIFVNNLTCILMKIYNNYKYVVVLGDFNVNFNQECQHTYDVLNTLKSFGLKQTIFEPTRVTATSSSCIDNIFINIPYSESIVVKERLSDHFAQLLSINSRENKEAAKPIFYRPTTKTGLDKLKNILHYTNWTPIFQSVLAEKAYKLFHDILINSYNHAFPVRKIVKNTKKVSGWYTDELKKIKTNLDLIYDISLSSNNNQNIKNLYRNYRKHYRNKLYLAKIQHNRNYIQSSDNKSKAVWEVIKKELGTCSEKPKTQITNNEFNEHFTTIAKNIHKELPSTSVEFEHFLRQSSLSPNCSLFLRPTDEYEIKDIIFNLKNKTSSDIYGLNTVIIKAICYIICIPLAHIFNLCLSQGVFPDALKIAKVIPLQKKANLDSIDNFRPISLLPIVSKILEAIIKTRLVSYFESNKLFSSKQFGYRSGKSTSHAVIHAAEFIMKNFENGQFIEGTFCDLCKAFDCMCHKILRKKLFFYGIRGVALELLCSFLSNRLQVVEIDHKHSTPLHNDNSVPQGSILGPFLFLIFINDLACITQEPDPEGETESVMFVDDVTLLSTSASKENTLTMSSQLLKKAEQWFVSNKLKLNKEKTQNILFHNRILTESQDNTVRFLGLQIDSKLSWKQHCVRLISSISKSSYALRKVTNLVPFETAKVAFHALVGSHLTYGILLWGATTHAAAVFRAQKKALRIICKLKHNNPCKQYFINNSIMTLPSIYMYHSLVYVRSNINSFPKINKGQGRDTRFGMHLETPRVRLDVSKNTPRYWGVKFFNKLPKNLQELSLVKFKRKIKVIFAQKGYYSFEEFLSDNLEL